MGPVFFLRHYYYFAELVKIGSDHHPKMQDELHWLRSVQDELRRGDVHSVHRLVRKRLALHNELEERRKAEEIRKLHAAIRQRRPNADAEAGPLFSTILVVLELIGPHFDARSLVLLKRSCRWGAVVTDGDHRWAPNGSRIAETLAEAATKYSEPFRPFGEGMCA